MIQDLKAKLVDASIKSKILIVSIVSGIPILLVLSYFIAVQYVDKRNDARVEVQSAVRAIAFQHAAQVEGLRSLLLALSKYPEIRLKDAAGCSKILNLIMEKSPSGTNIGVADSTGRVIATGIKQSMPIAYTVDDRKYFKDAIRTKKFSVGEFAVSRATQKPVLHFALPVLDYRGNVDLVLYATLELKSFCTHFDAQNFPRGSIINLTDHQGTIMLRYSHIGLDDQIGMKDRPDLRSNMTGLNEEGVFTGIGLDRVKRHLAFKRIRLSATDPPYLYIRVSIPEKIATYSATKTFYISIFIFLSAVVFTYILLNYIASRYVVRPIEQLVKAVQQVEGGDLSARSGVRYSVSEIGRLAKSFDDMTTSLEDRIREIGKAESEKHQLAYYDPVTALPNRRLLQERLQLAIARSGRQNSGFALLYIDIDDFKHINDSLGHSAGDRLLQVMAARYQSVLREDDFICRLGGDEFAVILHGFRRGNDVAIAAGKLLESTAESLEIEGRQLLVSASIGVAFYPKDAGDAQALEKHADIALYSAKGGGKNTFHMFSDELNRSSHERISLIHLLKSAVDRNELVLYYQPKVCNKTGRMTGVEALLRWNSTELGMVMPDKFIPVAEESRLIIPLGEWVLRNACKQQVAWKRLGNDLTMAVNISAVQFNDPRLVETVGSIIGASGIDPEMLELELTESALVDRPDEVIETLVKLRELKCNIAIDDFGTGYSSLSYLKDFPVSMLKIDRSFVKDICHNPSNRAIAQSVINLANNLNMVTVAEGVETVDQQVLLNDMGCCYVQGYLHSPPIPADDIPNIITRFKSA